MPIQADFTFSRYEDGILSVALTSPTAIGSWDIRFRVQRHFGGLSGLIAKSMASGFNNVSGIAVVNSGQGIFNVTLNSVDTSGLEYGNYAYSIDRFDSGNRTILTEGYVALTPSVG